MKKIIKSLAIVVAKTFIITSSILLCVVLFAVIVGGILSLATSGDTGPQLNYKTTFGNESSDNNILAIPVTGVIVGNANEVGANILNAADYTAGYDIESELDEAARDTSIKGVILEINSPGGELSGANAIAQGVARYRARTKKPVVAFIYGLGASGAYWTAISADYVFADYGSEVADIGVISGPFEYYNTVTAVNNGILSGGVVTQNGIQSTYIYAGQSKDLGNPYRQMTQNEVNVLQQAVNDDYKIFVNYVSNRRHISQDTIQNTIQALPYGNTQAQTYHLIDGTKSREETYSFLAKKSGIQDDFKVVTIQQPGGFISSLLQGFDKAPQPKASMFCSRVGILSYYGDVGKLCE